MVGIFLSHLPLTTSKACDIFSRRKLSLPVLFVILHLQFSVYCKPMKTHHSDHEVPDLKLF